METKKNRGIIPPVKDQRVLYVPVGCGKCMECKKQKSRQWQVRLTEDLKHNKNAWFVTLTFSDTELIKLERENTELTGYNLDNEVCRIAVRRYTERWRKKYKKTIRHWLVTELGHQGTERVHMHGIVWTKEKEDIEKIWKYGKVYIGEYVNNKTINYIIKYVNKIDELHREYNGKIYTSQGIGKKYIERKDSKRNKYKKNGTRETYKTKEGIELALPIYYRNKIYSEEEREKLWLEKLDKNKRYVLGREIDGDNEKDYQRALYEARKKNKRQGYGNNEKNWELKKYEEERRNIKKKERIKKAYGEPTPKVAYVPNGHVILPNGAFYNED